MTKPDGMTTPSDAKTNELASKEWAKPNGMLRTECLEMALRTPGMNGYLDIIWAAKAFEAHITGQEAV